ncbi:MAG: hypothetical protein Q7S53_05340 [bacterium]|nr:hypothetical protein [bacterium]
MGLVIKSGWSKGSKELGKVNGLAVCNGDIVALHGDRQILHCDDVHNVSIFNDLLPMDVWVGKKIEGIYPIEGSSMVMGPGSPTFHDDSNVLIMHFTDGSKSALFAEGSMLVGTSDKREDPDMDLLVKAGILSAEDKAERVEEIRAKSGLEKTISSSIKERGRMQSQLPGAGRKEGREIYKTIKLLESQITEARSKKDGKWKWAGYSFDCEVLLNFVPGMVDILDWRSKNANGYRSYLKTDQLLKPQDREIVAIHKIFEASENPKDRSQNVYSLEFPGRLFSLPFGICNGQWLEFSLHGLKTAGLVPAEEISRINDEIKKAAEEQDKEDDTGERLDDLYNELDEFDLGEKRTREIFAEIASLEASQDGEVAEKMG